MITKNDKFMNNNTNIWNIPYIDQPIEFWKELNNDFGDYINEVYFPLQKSNISTGRPEQPNTFLDNFIQQSPFKLSVLINPIILTKPVEVIASKIIEQLKELRENCNLHSVTVANPQLGEIIKNKIPDIRLNASVLMDIYSPFQFEMISDIFDVIVPSSRIVRDIRALKKLRENYKGEIRLIVNEGCLPDCVFRVQHFYEMGLKELPFPKSLCSNILRKNPWMRLTGSWILPQHLHLFDGLFDELKISGRVSLQNPEYYREVFDAYINRKNRFPCGIGGGPASILKPMKIEESFYKKTLYCDKSCQTCNICKEYWISLNM